MSDYTSQNLEDWTNFTANRRQYLTPAQHLAVGTWLISSGFIGGLLNLAALVMFVRFPKVLWNPSAIPEIGLLLSDLGVAGLHPFSGSSALMNRWLWGPLGCQLYSTAGFLFGSFQLFVIPFIAFDRFLITCKPGWEERYRNYGTYMKIFVALFVASLLFAVLPLVGWASYSLTPVGIACTIDWFDRSTSFTSYMTVYILFDYVIPMALAVMFYFFAYSSIKKGTAHSLHWTTKENAGVTILGCTLTTTVCFSGYAIAVLWAMIDSPDNIPSGINALPPPMAKIASVVNPIFYIYCHPLHWACMRQMLGCCSGQDTSALIEQVCPHRKIILEAAEVQKKKEIQLSARSNRSGGPPRIKQETASNVGGYSQEVEQLVIQ